MGDMVCVVEQNMTMNQRIFLILGSILSLFLVGCSQANGRTDAPNGAQHNGPKPMLVEVAPVIVGDATSVYVTTATLEPESHAEIRARTSGVVRALLCEEGDEVEQGTMLLTLEDDDQRLKVQQAELELKRSQGEFNRRTKMKASGVLSDEDFDTAENDLQMAQANLDMAKLELSYTRVVAPLDGKIVLRHVDLGANVEPGNPLFDIMDVHPLLVRFHVPANRLGTIAPGQKVQLKLDSTGEELEAEVALISPIVDEESGTVKVTAQLDEYTGRIRPGDFVEVRVVTERHPNALLIPSISIMEEHHQKYVFVVEDNRAVRRTVETGFVNGEMTEILSGLAPEEGVVVRGQRNLRDEAPVKLNADHDPKETTPGEAAAS